MPLPTVDSKEETAAAYGDAIRDVDMPRPYKLCKPANIDSPTDGSEAVAHGMVIEAVEPHTYVFDD